MKATISAGMVVVGILAAGLCGCSASFKVNSGSTPTVGADVLQKDLIDRLTAAGNPPQSVTCKDELVGEVGKTATCDVVMSETNEVQAVVTVTKVEGDTVNFDLAPALSKEQLEKAVTGIASAESASCETGLKGAVGQTAKCSITVDGTTTDNTVTVTKVEGGLSMNLSIT